jgi:hypothetical protein
MNPYIPAMNERGTKIKSVTFQRVEVREFEVLSFPAASPASPQQRRTSYDIDAFEQSIRRKKIQDPVGCSTIVEHRQQIPKCPHRISKRRPRGQEDRSSSINSSSSTLLREEQKEQRRKLSPTMPQRQRSLGAEELEAEIP